MPAAAALVDLGILLALVVLIGLRFGYSYTLGRVLLMSAALLNTVRIPTPWGSVHLLGFAADALVKADHAIMHGLGRGISDMQAAWNEALSYTAQAVHWIGHEIAALAHDTAQAVEHLHVTQVTNVYRKVNPGLAARVGALAAAVAVLRHQLVREASRVAHLAKAKAVAVEHAIAVPDVGAIPRVIPRLTHLERETTALEKWIKAHAPVLTVTAATGLLTAVLFRRLGLGWLRCKGVNRIGRSLCGMTGLIEALFADALLAFAAIDLCWFVRGVESAAETIRPLLLRFVDVENALIGRCGGEAAKPLRLTRISHTPVVDALTLKAL